MSRFFQLSEAASLALHVMVAVGVGEGPVSVKEMALKLCASEAHLAKVVQRLSKAGLVVTQRGPGGGVTLGRNACDITFLEIFETIEGPLDASPCVLGRGECPFKSCIFGAELGKAAEEIRSKFEATRLSDYISQDSLGKN